MLFVWAVRVAIVLVAAVAAVTDVRGRIVPDWLTLPAIALGLVAFATRMHWTGVELWALGVGLVAVPTVVPWLLGGYGGGDFKMSLAFGALGGPLFGWWALALGVAGGLPLFAGWAVWRRTARGQRSPFTGPPLAVALGVGAVAALTMVLVHA